MNPEEKSLRRELHALAVREGLTAEMLEDLIHEWAVHQREKEYKFRKAHLSSIYGMRVVETRNGSPAEMYCAHYDDFVQLIDGKCYCWRQGCRACGHSGYRDSDSYTHG